MFSPRKIDPAEAQSRGQAVIHLELNRIPDLFTLGAAPLLQSRGRLRPGDGIVDGRGRKHFRLADALEATAYYPHHSQDRAPKKSQSGPVVFSDVLLVLPEHQIRRDRLETGGEGLAALLGDLRHGLTARFGARVRDPGRPPRCAAIASADLHDTVLCVFGRMIALPAAGDVPVARLRIGASEDTLHEPTYLCAGPGNSLVEQPAGIYAGQHRITIGASHRSAPIAVALPGWEQRIVLDLESGRLRDAHGQDIGPELVDGARRLWQWPEPGPVIEIVSATAAALAKEDPAAPGQRNAADRQGVSKLRFLLGGGAPPRDKALPQALRAEPRLEVAGSVATALATGTDGITVIPLPRRQPVSDDTVIAKASLPPSPNPVDATLVPRLSLPRRPPVLVEPAETGATIVIGGGAAPAAQGYRLERVAIALPRLDNLAAQPPLRGWRLGLRADGISGADSDDVLMLGASCERNELWQRQPRQPKWRVAPRGAEGFALDLPQGWRLLASPDPARYHALLVPPTPETIEVQDGGIRVFGRRDGRGDASRRLSFAALAPGALETATGDRVSLDRLLSRDHVELRLLHRQLHLRLSDGKTGIWRLQADFAPVAAIEPGAGRELVLRDHDLFLVGCHVVRFQGC